MLRRCIVWFLPLAALLLILAGWVGIERWEGLRQRGYPFLHQQMLWSVVALGAMWGAAAMDYRWLGRWSYFLLFAIVLALTAVYFFPAVNGAHRWIRVGRFGFQPSEFAKVVVVLALSRYLMYCENYRCLRGLLVPLTLIAAPVLLVLKEPDLGTAVVFVPVLFAMLFIAGARFRDLALVVIAGVLFLPLFWTQMSTEQRSRVTSLLEQPGPEERPDSNSYQLYQAKQWMALGGGWGSLLAGEARDDPATYRLPEAQTDFIFCVLVERVGLAGMAAILALYGGVVGVGMRAAVECHEPMGRLIAAGVASLVAVEVLVNTGMTVGLLPVTGLPLPLVSYGGSGLVAHAAALGLVINVGLRPGYEMAPEPFRWSSPTT